MVVNVQNRQLGKVLSQPGTVGIRAFEQHDPIKSLREALRRLSADMNALAARQRTVDSGGFITIPDHGPLAQTLEDTGQSESGADCISVGAHVAGQEKPLSAPDFFEECLRWCRRAHEEPPEGH